MSNRSPSASGGGQSPVPEGGRSGAARRCWPPTDNPAMHRSPPRARSILEPAPRQEPGLLPSSTPLSTDPAAIDKGGDRFHGQGRTAPDWLFVPSATPECEREFMESRLSAGTESLEPVERGRGRKSAPTPRHRVLRRRTSSAARFLEREPRAPSSELRFAKNRRLAAAHPFGLAIVALWLFGAGSELRAAPAESIGLRCREACAEVLINGRHSGTAWLATRDGLFLTAAHLFERQGGQIELLTLEGQRIPARRLAIDRGHDLALMQAEAIPNGWRPLPLARRSPRVGERIWQYGAPIFRSGLLQAGHVASDLPAFEFHAEVTDYAEVVATAAMMQGGTSGGPWLNRKGEVVGVQSSTLSLEGKPAGVGYFAPLSAIRRLLETRRDADTPTPGLGVDELWQQSEEFIGRLPARTVGLVASVVRPDGPAARAGLQAQDVLTAANGRPLVRIADLPRALRARRPGESVDLRFLRPGEPGERAIQLVLGRAEDVWAAEPASATPEKGTP